MNGDSTQRIRKIELHAFHGSDNRIFADPSSPLLWIAKITCAGQPVRPGRPFGVRLTIALSTIAACLEITPYSVLRWAKAEKLCLNLTRRGLRCGDGRHSLVCLTTRARRRSHWCH